LTQNLNLSAIDQSDRQKREAGGRHAGERERERERKRERERGFCVVGCVKNSALTRAVSQ
jgi:hypothetical protein